MGTLHEDQRTFTIIFRSFLLRMRNVSDKSCRENQNIHFASSNFSFPSRSAFEITWKTYGTARQVTGDSFIRRMRFACRVTKATDTHSEYAILIAFPLQQWLCERASMLRYTYSACLVFILTKLHHFLQMMHLCEQRTYQKQVNYNRPLCRQNTTR